MLFNCGLHPLSSIQLGHIKGWSQSLVTLWNKICEFIYQGNLTIGMKYHLIKVFIKDWAMGDKSLVMPADYFCVSSFTQCSSIIFVWQIFQPVRQKITEQRHWLSVSVCASYGGWWLAPLSPECSWSSWWLSWSSPHCPFVTVFKPGPALHHVTAKLTPPPPLHKYNCHLVFCIVKLVKKMICSIEFVCCEDATFPFILCKSVRWGTLQKLCIILEEPSRPKQFTKLAGSRCSRRRVANS